MHKILLFLETGPIVHPVKMLSKTRTLGVICLFVLLYFSLYGEVEKPSLFKMLTGSRVRQVTGRLVDVEPEECLRTSKFETSKNCYAFKS